MFVLYKSNVKINILFHVENWTDFFGSSVKKKKKKKKIKIHLMAIMAEVKLEQFIFEMLKADM